MLDDGKIISAGTHDELMTTSAVYQEIYHLTRIKRSKCFMSEPVNSNTPLTPVGLPGRRGHISIEKPKNSKQVIRRLWNYLSREKSLLLLSLFFIAD